MRKVFIDSLPKWEKGSHEGKINWQKTVGLKIHFIYDEIEDEVLVIDYNKKKSEINIFYNNNNFWIKTNNFSYCKIGHILKGIKENIKSMVGTIIKTEKNNVEILEEIKEKREGEYDFKYLYKYHCKKCGNIDWTTRRQIMEDKYICNVCCIPSHKVLKGYNDIATTDPWMCDYLINEEDWYKYTSKSNARVEMNCPYCKYKKKYTIEGLKQIGYLPCYCRDGIKYPEKFLGNILKQLKINFIYQYSNVNNEWCKNKRYDFYFERNNEEYIIETHGVQHYKNETFFSNSLSEQQKNDQYKYDLAIQNGIKPENYIVIDCRKSELEWIKNSILNSRLAEVFDLDNIDWERCHEESLKNIVKEVCDYWYKHVNINKEILTTGDLSKLFNMSITTIAQYLKKGTELKWCDYKPIIGGVKKV